MNETVAKRLENAQSQLMIEYGILRTLRFQEGTFDLISWVLIGMSIFWKVRLIYVAFMSIAISFVWLRKRIRQSIVVTRLEIEVRDLRTVKAFEEGLKISNGKKKSKTKAL